MEFICPVCTAQRLPTARAKAVARVAAASEKATQTLKPSEKLARTPKSHHFCPAQKANRYAVNSATKLTHHVAIVKSQNAIVWAMIPFSRPIACPASNLRP